MYRQVHDEVEVQDFLQEIEKCWELMWSDGSLHLLNIDIVESMNLI